MFDCWVHANHLRICLAVDQTWKSIERGTAYASTRVQGLAVFFFEQYAEREWERMMTPQFHIVEELLNAWRVAHRRVGIRSARRAFRWVNSVFSVNVIQIFRLGVIRLELLIAERPCGRDAAIVADFSKILFAKSQ